MISHRFIRFMATKSVRPKVPVSFISKPPTKPKHYADNEPVQAVTNREEPAEQEVRFDDLYRYLWVKCRGHEIEVLDSYERFLKQAAGHLDIEHVKTETPFRVIKRKTMLASRFVKKKYRVQYEVRTYFRDLCFKNLTGSTLGTYLEYVERNLPDGVMMIAEKHRLAELPFDLTDESDQQSDQEVQEDRDQKKQ